MFPDSILAKNFQYGAKKVAYMATFSIASYLQDKLKMHVIENGFYVLLFDENLNKKTQEKQLNFHLRF